MRQSKSQVEAKQILSEPPTSAKKKARASSTTTSRVPRILNDGHRQSKTAEARKRLGVDEEARNEIPDLTKKVIAGAGSIAKAVEALSQDDSEDARAFIESYRSVSQSDRARLVLEDFVAASGLTARRFIEVLTGALMQQCQDVTKMMVAVAQPKVIQATIKAATDQVPITAYNATSGMMEVVGHTNGDTKAMEIFHKATGFLPTPKGAVTNISLNQLNQTANGVSQEDDDDKDPMDLPDMDDYLLEIQGVIRPQLEARIAPTSEIPNTMPIIEELEIEI